MDANGVQHQQDDPCETQSDTTSFLPCDGLFQSDSSHKHGENGSRGSDDGRVERCGEFTRLKIGELGEKKSQHGGNENAAKIFEWDFLLG